MTPKARHRRRRHSEARTVYRVARDVNAAWDRFYAARDKIHSAFMTAAFNEKVLILPEGVKFSYVSVGSVGVMHR